MAAATPPLQVPGIADPETCGEDHYYNLGRVTEIARTYCGDCEEYHVTTAANRLTKRTGWSRGTRPAMVGAVRQCLVAQAETTAGPLDVTIAAAADTSILAACAHAAWTAGAAVFARTRFTVIDKCRTPLELCRDFAARHGLRVELATMDLTQPDRAFPSDAIVLHSVLTFLPPNTRVPFLHTCSSWLKQGGRICAWTGLKQGYDSREQLEAVRIAKEMRALVEAGLVSGQVKLNEPAETFLARLEHMTEKRRGGLHQIASVDDVRSLLAESGLQVCSFEQFDHAIEMPDGIPLIHANVLSILGPPAAQ
jgi:hypothetical protein